MLRPILRRFWVSYAVKRAKDDDTGAADDEVEVAVAPEDVDDASHDEADEEHEERAPHGAEVPLGDGAVNGHGAEHGCGAAKGLADGVEPVAHKDGPEEDALHGSKYKQQGGECPGAELVCGKAHDDHEPQGAEAEQQAVFCHPGQGVDVLRGVGGHASGNQHAGGKPHVYFVKESLGEGGAALNGGRYGVGVLIHGCILLIMGG